MNVLGVFLVFSVIVSCAQSQCNISEPHHQDCAALFKIFRSALFNTSVRDNIFLLQSVFYPDTQISPVLVKVTYKLNMTSSINMSYQSKISCSGSNESVCFQDGVYTFGWTSRDIYLIFHPVIINHLRFQQPFWLLQISESLPYLTDNYDLEALLWDGRKSLTSLDLVLNVDLTGLGCYPTTQLIEQALGELNQWLRAFAKVSQRETYHFATAEDKGVTLDCTSVENYTSSVNDFSPDAQYGRGILKFTYSIGFVLAITLAPILIPLLFKVIRDLLQTPDNKVSYNKLTLAGATTICASYTMISVSIAFYQLLTRYINEFDHMKAGFMFGLLVWLFVVTFISAFYFKFDKKFSPLQKCILHVAGFVAVFSLSSLTGILMLSFAPTILLLFVYPVDTSSLLALHVALFYSTTIVLAVFFRSVKEWVVNHRHIINATFNRNDAPFFNRDDDGCCNKFLIYAGILLHILLGMVLVALLPLTYVCLILLYQFVVARSEHHQLLAYSNFAAYIPSIIIAVFGFIIKKGAFDMPDETTKSKLNKVVEKIHELIEDKLQEPVKDEVHEVRS